MICPRCGPPEVDEPSCPRCGVVFAKLSSRARPPLPSVAAPEAPAESQGGGQGWIVALLVALAMAGTAGFWLRAPRPRHATATATLPIPAPPAATEAPLDAPPPATTPITLPPLHVDTASIPPVDRQAATDLAARLDRHQTSAADVDAAEGLVARYPNEPGLRLMLSAALIELAKSEQRQRQTAAAASHFGRAIALDPRSLAARLLLLRLELDVLDWAAAETAAREALSLDAANMEALEGLAFALFRQDRGREAADVLRRAMELGGSAGVRALLARIEKNSLDEKGMTEQRLAHFHVRYDGDTHEDVGRAILSVLERHWATLARTFDDEPTATIPVILFSREQYYDASGAPSWSGGVFDNVDGRIRVPIGGLSESLPSDLDSVLLHEVTHAFINDVTRGTAPRDLHEGLAQYMEGKRIDRMLTPQQMQALAQGRAQGVGGVYLEALSFVEYLQRAGGQSAINELLRGLGETGNLDEAYRRAFGDDYRTVRQRWLETRWRQFGD